MRNFLVDRPFFAQSRPVWLPVWTLCLTLYGVMVLHWDVQPIIYLFWCETALMLAVGLIKTVFAMNGQTFSQTILLKLFLLSGGVTTAVGLAFFAFLFTFQGFAEGGDFTKIHAIATQRNLMALGYAVQLGIHFFANGAYRKASPIGEMILPLIRLLTLLGFLQVFTMHWIPNYVATNQAMWIVVALVVVKFVVDVVFTRINAPFQTVFQQASLENGK
jgi:hypothetical protein